MTTYEQMVADARARCADLTRAQLEALRDAIVAELVERETPRHSCSDLACPLVVTAETGFQDPIAGDWWCAKHVPVETLRQLYPPSW